MLHGVVQSEQFQKQLGEKKKQLEDQKAAISEREKKMTELINHLKENAREKKNLEGKIKDCEVTTVIDFIWKF